MGGARPELIRKELDVTRPARAQQVPTAEEHSLVLMVDELLYTQPRCSQQFQCGMSIHDLIRS